MEVSLETWSELPRKESVSLLCIQSTKTSTRREVATTWETQILNTGMQEVTKGAAVNCGHMNSVSASSLKRRKNDVRLERTSGVPRWENFARSVTRVRAGEETAFPRTR